jgi:hypothetical protein
MLIIDMGAVNSQARRNNTLPPECGQPIDSDGSGFNQIWADGSGVEGVKVYFILPEHLAAYK